jgi:hypothetical protein
MPARPFGHSLANFGELRPAEQKLLESCRSGDDCVIAAFRPKADGKSVVNSVRAGFLRFLILGGDDENPVHERGVRIKGAWIDDVLDLQGVASSGAVSAIRCWFDQRPDLRNAHISGVLNLTGSRVPGLKGDRLTCASGLFCRDKFFSEGEVRLLGAEIGGSLSFRGANFNRPLKGRKPAGGALSADRINVKGGVFLNGDFTAHGTVRLSAAVIGGNLECTGATFNGPLNADGKRDDALNAGRIAVKGNALLNNDFAANGTVRLNGATIGGNLDCKRATFRSGSGWSIQAERSSVSGLFYFKNLRMPAEGVDLSSARVRILVDDFEAWGEEINLGGFTYERFANSSDTDVPTQTDVQKRIAWVYKQEASGHDGKPGRFLPQPWLQLRKVLREEGHAEDARLVGIAFEKRRRKRGQIKGLVPRILHRFYGIFTGYGYRPIWLFYWTFGVWLVCATVYDVAARLDEFSPTNFAMYEDPACRHQLAIAKQSAPANPVYSPPCNMNYPVFSPLVYSLNVLLPVVELGEEAAWTPNSKPFSPVWWRNLVQPFSNWGNFVQLLIWLETLFGWVAGLLLVAVVSGLARRQDDS